MTPQQAINVIENSIILDTKIPDALVVELCDALNTMRRNCQQ